jgi:hypothetical protein
MACARISDEFGRTLLSRVRVNDARRHDRTHDVLRPATSCSVRPSIDNPGTVIGERLMMRVQLVSPRGRT